MSHTVTLPSTLASPSRVFLSPFPPPESRPKTADGLSPRGRHSIYPYKISTDLARAQGRYSAKVSSEVSHHPISTKEEYSHDEFISLYYYDRQRKQRTDHHTKRPLTPSVSSSTSLLKNRQPRQSSPSPTKWIKHVSQSSGLLNLEKKLTRGFPFRSPPTLHLSLLPDHPPPKAIYHGSVLARQYLKSVTQLDRWDEMIQQGFPCPHALRMTEEEEALSPVKPRCPSSCHQCGGHQRLMTLRITFTPLHARANENDIYNPSQRRRGTVGFSTP